MSFISNLLNSEEKTKTANDAQLKDGGNVFLFDSDDESMNTDLKSESEPKRKRKTSLLKKIRNAFDKSDIIESDHELQDTQPTQKLSKQIDDQPLNVTQPTQMNIIQSTTEQSITQPTQLKDVPAESVTQLTQLKGEPIGSVTQPTQLKGVFEEAEDVDIHVETQETQMQEPTLSFKQPTQLKTQKSKSQSGQLKAIFDEELEDEFLEKMNAPVISTENSTNLKAMFDDSDDSLFEELPEVPGSEKTMPVGEEAPVVASEDEEYNSEVSDFVIELESDKEDENKLCEEEKIPEEKKKQNETVPSQQYILLSDDDDDDEFDNIGSRHNESAAAKATALEIQAHIARQMALKDKDNLRNKKKNMDVQDLFAQLKKKAVKQAQKTRVNLEVVEKNITNNSDRVKKNESAGELSSEEENDHFNLDSDYDGDQQSNLSDVVIEQQEEEIFYGKKTSPVDTFPLETNNPPMNSPTRVKEVVNEDDDEKEKRRLERARLRRKALENDLKDNVENPFLAEEAEESESDEENIPILNENKTDGFDEEKVDDALHTSDEEMLDDDSDIEENEEVLRQLEREQQARDEELLEKQIQKTLKGERRGIDREEGFIDDDNDFEQDDEYIAYKRRQEAIEAKINKRLSKSKKSRINVLEGVNTRVSLPENKIGVLDKLTVSSTLSFLTRDSTIDDLTAAEEKQHEDDDFKLKFKTQVELFSTAATADENLDDDDDQADSLMFMKNTRKIVKKPAIESEEMKFRLGVKTFTKNHMKNTTTKTIANNEKFGYNKEGKREVPFLGKKRKPDSNGLYSHPVKKSAT
ncbi:hypothetical protein ACO0R3_001257 [Hanseniaspora guilliermondii]